METPVAQLLADHRRLDNLLGRFFAASQRRDCPAARAAIEEFDDELRRHTRTEEDEIYLKRVSGKLAETDDETPAQRLARELRLEHVQIRELSGMMCRLLAENQDIAGAQALATNLARRWDAHTMREEKEVFTELD